MARGCPGAGRAGPIVSVLTTGRPSASFAERGADVGRVALIGPVIPSLGGSTPGGVATHQVHLAATLARQGVRASLLATNAVSAPGTWQDEWAGLALYRMARPQDVLDALIRYLPAVGTRAAVQEAVALASRGDEGLGARRTVLGNVLWYRRFLRTARPDVVHVQHPLERCSYARRALLSERLHVPLVVTAHSLFGEHEDATIRRLMAPNLRAADAVIAVSPHVGRQAEELGVDVGRITVIRSGVDTLHLQPQDRDAARARVGVAGPGPHVLFVGNLEPRKALDVLVRAWTGVGERLPGATLWIVGSGESAGADDQGPLLKRLVAALGVGGSVRFVGRVPDDDLASWYAAAHVFVLPSHSEAQGIVALEAMACGTPVVASAVGGLLGTIQDGETGLLVPAGAIEPLRDALLKLLSDPEWARVVAQAGRKKVEEEFSWDVAARATQEVYARARGVA